jgi:hypothetical protein
MGTRNKIGDLRNHLFIALESLLDEENPMPVERAKAIAEVASVLVESAKAEVLFLKVTGQTQGSGFIPEDTKQLQ